jgi:hypothetical protein
VGSKESISDTILGSHCAVFHVEQNALHASMIHDMEVWVVLCLWIQIKVGGI